MLEKFYAVPIILISVFGFAFSINPLILMVFGVLALFALQLGDRAIARRKRRSEAAPTDP